MSSGLCGNSVAAGCNGSRQTGVSRSTDTAGLGTCATRAGLAFRSELHNSSWAFIRRTVSTTSYLEVTLTGAIPSPSIFTVRVEDKGHPCHPGSRRLRHLR